MTVKVSRTSGKYLYINLLNFKDRREQTRIFKQIQKLLESQA